LASAAVTDAWAAWVRSWALVGFDGGPPVDTEGSVFSFSVAFAFALVFFLGGAF
jgi:hypothetical protein